MKTCYIVGALECAADIDRRPEDLVIACDGGLKNLERAGIKPDLITGDFDSLGYVPEGENVISLPRRKDDTDMLFAVREGLRRGYESFEIYGAVGGRTDHTAANIQTLIAISKAGGRGVLIGCGERMTVIRDSITFPADMSGYISVFAVGGNAEGVSIKGLEYTLENAVLTPDFPVGVSNEFCGKAAEISVESGFLLIIWFDKSAAR